jgi:hypothetical protein
MQRLYTRIAEPQWIPLNAGVVYTNPGSTSSYIKSIVVFNSSSSTANIKLYNVPDDAGSIGTATLGNQFLDVDLVGRETFMFDLPYPITLIDANDTLQAVCSSANTAVIQILGDIAQ